MLKRRLIPKIQIRRSSGGNRYVAVTTLGFKGVVEIGDPVSQAKIYQAQAADELIFVDITASAEGRPTFIESVRAASEEIFMPITVGGGVRSVEDFRSLLNCGADKVSINTEALVNPKLVEMAAKRFGAQCVVVAIDYSLRQSTAGQVFGKGGSEPSGRSVVEWARQVEKLGAGEILLTCMDRDGTRQGLDLDMVQQVVDAVKIPVIASGGCGQAEHFVEAFRVGNLSAVAAGTYFSFKDENPMQCRSQIANAGIPIRMVS